MPIKDDARLLTGYVPTTENQQQERKELRKIARASIHDRQSVSC
jgi:hypothetical protein